MAIKAVASELFTRVMRVFETERNISPSIDEYVKLSMDMITLMTEALNYKGAQDISGSAGGKVPVLTCGRDEIIWIDGGNVATTAGNKQGWKTERRGVEFRFEGNNTTTPEHTDFQLMRLEQGDVLNVLTTGNGADSAITCYVAYYRLRIRNS